MTEEWKDIEGYEGLYQVSNLANVRTVPRETKKTIKKSKMIEPHVNQNGFLVVELKIGKTKRNYALQYLVAKAFIPNPDKIRTVSFKDDDKNNCKADNLEWRARELNKECFEELSELTLLTGFYKDCFNMTY